MKGPETARPEAAIVGAVLGEGGAVSVNYEDRGEPGRSAYVPPTETREQVLARGRPFPPHEEMVIEELTDEEAEAFWVAINEA